MFRAGGRRALRVRVRDLNRHFRLPHYSQVGDVPLVTRLPERWAVSLTDATKAALFVKVLSKRHAARRFNITPSIAKFAGSLEASLKKASAESSLSRFRKDEKFTQFADAFRRVSQFRDASGADYFVIANGYVVG